MILMPLHNSFIRLFC